jgi:hypothetical protein
MKTTEHTLCPALNNVAKGDESTSQTRACPKAVSGKEKRDVRPCEAKQICRTKGLTSADRSNKATLLLTVPRPDSSRLQRIHPRTYHGCNSRTNRPDISVRPTKPT